MKGVLIYDSNGYKINTWFANRIIEVGKIYDIEIVLKIVDNTDNFEDFSKYKFAIIRSINPALTKHLEDSGIVCFNNFATSNICNDKYKTYLMLKKLNLPILETYLYGDESYKNLTYPFVVKSVDGHGGKEVFLVNCESELKNVILPSKKYICQQLCDTPSTDMRLYMLNHKLVKAVFRKSNGDFRSNFTLGGSATMVTPTPKQIEYATIISKHLGSTFIGVDFIYHNGNVIVNEIEDVVGTRMLYSVYNYDIVIDYIKHIKNTLKCL